MTTAPPAKQLAGVRFRKAGKIYTYDATAFDLDPGDYVIVDTSTGPDLAHVVIAPGQMLGGDAEGGQRRILRVATGEDREAKEEAHRRAIVALEFARLRSGEHRTGMLLASADFNLDLTTLTLFYEAEDSVDYRAVVRDVTQEFAVNVVVERVGPRDRAKLIGGYDRCGQELCCTSWLTSFPSVSIKMAKTQNLPLNPAKISGVCGRLYCCLTYEYEVYRDLREQLPRLNQRVETPTGEAKVINVDPLKQTVTLLLEDRSRIEVTKDQLQYGKLVRPLDVDAEALASEDESRPPPPAGPSATIELTRPRPPVARPAPPPRGRTISPPGPSTARPPGPPGATPPAGPPGGPDTTDRRPRRRRGGRGGGGSAGEAARTAPQPEARSGPPPAAAGDTPVAGGEGAAPRRRRRRRGGGTGGDGGGPGEGAPG